MAALKAEVSCASKIKFKTFPSFFIMTLERLDTGARVSGSKALNIESNCSFDLNFRRILALALIRLVPPSLALKLFSDQSPPFVEEA
jgi:hypothetical protein